MALQAGMPALDFEQIEKNKGHYYWSNSCRPCRWLCVYEACFFRGPGLLSTAGFSEWEQRL